MKLCPICQTTYDDAQNFCLHDGATLVFATQALNNPSDEPATVIHSTAPPGSIGFQTAPVIVPPKTNSGLLIALTAVTTLLLVGLGIGAYFLLTPKPAANVAQNNQNVDNSNRPANPANKANTASPNVVNAAPSPAASVAPPAPKPTLTATQTAEIEKDVFAAVGDWKQATQNEDLEAHLSYYAPTVNYYKGGKVPISRVRADRQKAFDTYDDLNVEISNLKITPDPSGTKAVAVFDKDYEFSNAETISIGKVQQQLTLEKINGRWLINGEKDLKIYSKSK